MAQKSHMKEQNLKLRVVDLFAGAGGLSLGFEEAGFKIAFAVEKDPYSAETYKKNREKMNTEPILIDMSRINFTNALKKFGLNKGEIDVLLSGPPCQGFSQSNMRTRSLKNPKNHLFKEFIRAVREIYPKWILFENVSGIVNFEKGKIVEIMKSELEKFGYSCIWSILNAADYSIPQIRRRFFLIGNRMGADFLFPHPSYGYSKKPRTTVRDAIFDLPVLKNGNKDECLPYRHNSPNISEYQREMRRNWYKNYCMNNQVTANSSLVVRRYTFIQPGSNWMDIPAYLLKNYKNKKNCHSGIYKRLKWDEPSIVVGNFRKNMLVHPEQDRGLSVREAARLQSFPDWYTFYGGLSSQQQQVADAVPPRLAYTLAISIKEKIS